MTLDEAKTYIDNEIKQVSNNGRYKTYVMNLPIDNDGRNIIEFITNYLHSKQISIDMHLCGITNTYDLLIWW
jgi:hypothetical protein